MWITGGHRWVHSRGCRLQTVEDVKMSFGGYIVLVLYPRQTATAAADRHTNRQTDKPAQLLLPPQLRQETSLGSELARHVQPDLTGRTPAGFKGCRNCGLSKKKKNGDKKVAGNQMIWGTLSLSFSHSHIT